MDYALIMIVAFGVIIAIVTLWLISQPSQTKSNPNAKTGTTNIGGAPTVGTTDLTKKLLKILRLYVKYAADPATNKEHLKTLAEIDSIPVYEEDNRSLFEALRSFWKFIEDQNLPEKINDEKELFELLKQLLTT